MNVKEIITTYLRQNGYTGLSTDDCCCKLDNNYMECDYIPKRCKPAYTWECGKCNESDCWRRESGGECQKPDKQPG